MGKRSNLTSNDKDRAEFQILAWWKVIGAQTFPTMTQVARSVLCIPASTGSSKSEYNFSDAGDTLTKLRNSLKTAIVDDLMFLQSNQYVIN